MDYTIKLSFTAASGVTPCKVSADPPSQAVTSADTITWKASKPSDIVLITFAIKEQASPVGTLTHIGKGSLGPFPVDDSGVTPGTSKPFHYDVLYSDGSNPPCHLDPVIVVTKPVHRG